MLDFFSVVSICIYCFNFINYSVVSVNTDNFSTLFAIWFDKDYNCLPDINKKTRPVPWLDREFLGRFKFYRCITQSIALDIPTIVTKVLIVQLQTACVYVYGTSTDGWCCFLTDWLRLLGKTSIQIVEYNLRRTEGFYATWKTEGCKFLRQPMFQYLSKYMR